MALACRPPRLVRGAASQPRVAGGAALALSRSAGVAVEARPGRMVDPRILNRRAGHPGLRLHLEAVGPAATRAAEVAPGPAAARRAVEGELVEAVVVAVAVVVVVDAVAET